MGWQVPADFTFGEVLTSTRLNQIRGSFDYLDGFETDTDPSGWWDAATTTPTIGNGTGVQRWRKTGRRLDLSMTIEAGGTTTDGSGAYRFTWPASAEVSGTNAHLLYQLGGGVGTNGRPVVARAVTATTFELLFDAVDGGGIVGSTNWGDAIAVTGTVFCDS